MKVYTFTPFGYEGALVNIEVDLRSGIPAFDIIGLADSKVKETRERVRCAFSNSGIDFPSERVLIALSPYDLRKDCVLDVAIAASILTQQVKNTTDESVLVLGELDLKGNVLPVRGVHAALSTAIATGITKAIVPFANANECQGMDIELVLVQSLFDVKKAIEFGDFYKMDYQNDYEYEKKDEVLGIEFAPLTQELDKLPAGYDKAIWAMTVAAAGGHHMIFTGNPGCGKTLLMKSMPWLVPLNTIEEAQTVKRIWSLAGLVSPTDSLHMHKPFRTPRQTASIEDICGGGTNCRPGEISLAHNGILFLDDAAEFRTSVLQMLRVPLESHSITLSRAGRSTVYPANFQLLMATNPCPCGNFGSNDRICLCTVSSVNRYWNKLSGPLLERIDIRVQVEKKGSVSQSIKVLRESIAKATIMQRKRGKKNNDLTSIELAKFCKIDKKCQSILDRAIVKYSLSPRAVNSILKLARTIADMELKDSIEVQHIKSAIKLRQPLPPFEK